MKGVLAVLFLATRAFAIWPLPMTLSTGNEALWIDRNVTISYKGASSVCTCNVNIALA